MRIDIESPAPGPETRDSTESTPATVRDLVARQLQSARRELIDRSLNNRLVNCHLTGKRGKLGYDIEGRARTISTAAKALAPLQASSLFG